MFGFFIGKHSSTECKLRLIGNVFGIAARGERANEQDRRHSVKANWNTIFVNVYSACIIEFKETGQENSFGKGPFLC